MPLILPPHLVHRRHTPPLLLPPLLPPIPAPPALPPLLLHPRRRRRPTPAPYLRGRSKVVTREGDGAPIRAAPGLLALAALRAPAAGARGVRRGVDVLAVDVDGVGDEGRAAVAPLRVALLEAEELELRVEEVEEAHGGDALGWDLAVFVGRSEDVQRRGLRRRGDEG